MAEVDSNKSSLTNELTSAVRANLTAALAAGIGGGLIAAALGVWALIVTIPGKLGIMPTGAVVAFAREEKCPIGWDTYKEGTGRFIIGASTNEMIEKIPGAFARDSRSDPIAVREYNKAGGEQTHQLTVAEMPKHQHNQDSFGGGPAPVPYGTYPSAGRALLVAKTRDYGPDVGAKVDFAGEDKPHNIMPPYVALWLCVKQ